MPPKLKLEYKTNVSKRNATFRKRKNGLIRKVDELSTLCGIEACAIIYNHNAQPQVFPSEDKAKSILDKVRAMPDVEQSMNKLDQEGLMNQMILKAQKKLEKQQEDTRKKKMTDLMHQLMNRSQVVDNISTSDLEYLSSLIDENLKEVEEKIKLIESQEVAENIGTQTMNTEEGENINMGHVQGNVMGGDQENVGNVQIDQDWSINFTNN